MILALLVPHEILTLQVLLVALTRKRHRGQPRTRWCDCISDLALSRLGVKPAELSDIAENHEVFQDFLGLLPPRPSPEEKQVLKGMILPLHRV